MRVYKNLMGDGSKIDASEVWLEEDTLDNSLKKELDKKARHYYYQITPGNSEIISLRTGYAYLIMTTVASKDISYAGAYLVWSWGGGYNTLYAIKNNNRTEIALNNEDNEIIISAITNSNRVMILEFGGR